MVLLFYNVHVLAHVFVIKADQQLVQQQTHDMINFRMTNRRDNTQLYFTFVTNICIYHIERSYSFFSFTSFFP